MQHIIIKYLLDSNIMSNEDKIKQVTVVYKYYIIYII